MAKVLDGTPTGSDAVWKVFPSLNKSLQPIPRLRVGRIARSDISQFGNVFIAPDLGKNTGSTAYRKVGIGLGLYGEVGQEAARLQDAITQAGLKGWNASGIAGCIDNHVLGFGFHDDRGEGSFFEIVDVACINFSGSDLAEDRLSQAAQDRANGDAPIVRQPLRVISPRCSKRIFILLIGQKTGHNQGTKNTSAARLIQTQGNHRGLSIRMPGFGRIACEAAIKMFWIRS